MMLLEWYTAFIGEIKPLGIICIYKTEVEGRSEW